MPSRGLMRSLSGPPHAMSRTGPCRSSAIERYKRLRRCGARVMDAEEDATVAHFQGAEAGTFNLRALFVPALSVPTDGCPGSRAHLCYGLGSRAGDDSLYYIARPGQAADASTRGVLTL